MQGIATAIIVGLIGGALILGCMMVYAVNIYLAAPKNTVHDVNLPKEINVVHHDQRSPDKVDIIA